MQRHRMSRVPVRVPPAVRDVSVQRRVAGADTRCSVDVHQNTPTRESASRSARSLTHWRLLIQLGKRRGPWTQSNRLTEFVRWNSRDPTRGLRAAPDLVGQHETRRVMSYPSDEGIDETFVPDRRHREFEARVSVRSETLLRPDE